VVLLLVQLDHERQNQRRLHGAVEPRAADDAEVRTSVPVTALGGDALVGEVVATQQLAGSSQRLLAVGALDLPQDGLARGQSGHDDAELTCRVPDVLRGVWGILRLRYGCCDRHGHSPSGSGWF